MLCNCCAICRRSFSLARGLRCSCTSYTNCCKDISWLGPLIFLHEGSVEIIFSHRWVIGGQVLEKHRKHQFENSVLVFFYGGLMDLKSCLCTGPLLFHLAFTCRKIYLLFLKKVNCRNHFFTEISKFSKYHHELPS